MHLSCMQVSVVTAPLPRARMRPADPPGGRGAWIAWGIAATAYLVDLAHRMSLGVAAVDAEQRLAVGAGAVTLLAAVQILVYVLGQIPAGLLADRIGPRRTIAIGLTIMAVGEGVFALSTTLAPSVLGRVLIGAGDATIFLSVLRVAASWFPRRQFGFVTALTASMGCLGQLATTLPLTFALGAFGWTSTFGAGALLTLVVAVVILSAVRERPPGVRAPQRHEHPPVLAGLRAAWAKPTTRTGCLIHFALMTPFGALSTLWGHPYLVEVADVSDATASAILLVAVAASGVAAPAIGLLAARRRDLRQTAVVAISGAITAALVVLLVTAGSAPPVVLAAALAVTAVGMSGSMLGFDAGREGDDGHNSAAIAALVNLGGWSGTVALQVGLAASHGISVSRWMLLPLIVMSAGATIALVRRGDARAGRRVRPRLVTA